MKAWLINRKLASAHKALEAMQNHCEIIAKELQPYFEEEISVFWQPSDGFVVIQETEECNAPSNYSVNQVIEELKNDKNAYRSLNSL